MSNERKNFVNDVEIYRQPSLFAVFVFTYSRTKKQWRNGNNRGKLAFLHLGLNCRICYLSDSNFLRANKRKTIK
jgi:hypothetical protein